MMSTNGNTPSAAQALRAQLAEVDKALALTHDDLFCVGLMTPEAEAIWDKHHGLLVVRKAVVMALRHEGVVEFL